LFRRKFQRSGGQDDPDISGENHKANRVCRYHSFCPRGYSKTGIKEGFCIIFIPHTTAAITINENADPSVVQDLMMAINKMAPLEAGYHHLEGNSAAHIKSSLVGCSKTILIESGRLVLGTWQGIFFCEFDGPRSRKVHVKVVKEESLK
jgi:secondary thiamine-phosphate synthase enzyme